MPRGIINEIKKMDLDRFSIVAFNFYCLSSVMGGGVLFVVVKKGFVFLFLLSCHFVLFLLLSLFDFLFLFFSCYCFKADRALVILGSVLFISSSLLALLL